jgi:hypothetical protein
MGIEATDEPRGRQTMSLRGRFRSVGAARTVAAANPLSYPREREGAGQPEMRL